MIRMSDDTTAQVPGQQALDDLAKPIDRAQIDDALRAAPANGDAPAAAAKPARGPGGKFAPKSLPPEHRGDAPLQRPTADERDRADEARLQELAGELNAEPCADCPPEPSQAAARGLGVLVLAAGATLLYIGFDLLSRGAASRRLGGGRRWDDQP